MQIGTTLSSHGTWKTVPLRKPFSRWPSVFAVLGIGEGSEGTARLLHCPEVGPVLVYVHLNADHT